MRDDETRTRSDRVGIISRPHTSYSIKENCEDKCLVNDVKHNERYEAVRDLNVMWGFLRKRRRRKYPKVSVGIMPGKQESAENSAE